LQHGRVGEADESLARALKIDPARDSDLQEEVCALQLEILKRRGDIQGTRVLEKKLAAIRLARHGERLLQAKLLTQALTAFSQAAALCPGDAVVQSTLADCLHREFLLPQSEAHYAKAFESISDSLGESSRRDNRGIAEMFFDPKLLSQGLVLIHIFVPCPVASHT
jgi:tetratricopeptide (TPR) repeat protein